MIIRGTRTVTRVRLPILALAMMLCACGDHVTSPGDREQRAIANAVFDPDLETFRVRVYYEVGAAPYDGAIGISGNQTWDIMEASYQELFQSFPGRTIDVPESVAEMMPLESQARSEWSSTALVDLGNAVHSSFQPQPGEVHVGLIFLTGTFEGDATVLGVHVRGYPFAFVFKDRVTSLVGSAAQQRYVEQAVAVHEIGHAIGLVNNGVTMSVQHEDQAHPKHTTNENGVMYWAIETTSGVEDFVADVLGTSELELFGPECLADAQHFRPR